MKGVLHTIEVVVVLVILLAAVASTFKPIQPADNSAMLSLNGYSTLRYIDYTGTLRQAAAARNPAAIRNSLIPYLNNFELELCDPDCHGTDRYGAAAIDYFVSGDQSFDPVHIRLYLW